MKYITIRDSLGILRPMAVLWPSELWRKYHQPEIDKYMKKASKEGSVLVEVEIVEVKELTEAIEALEE